MADSSAVLLPMKSLKARLTDERRTSPASSAGASGPGRLCKFCALVVVVPIICLCVPIYMRFQALRPHTFSLSPSDMKLLNQESRVSTVWCQAQELTMNGSFNAYLLPERPKLHNYRQHVTMHRKMMLKDDIKEFWGFYLLRGSYVHLSVCSRHEGASFIVVRGVDEAKRCAWLGELDSNEDSNEISAEFEFSKEIADTDGSVEMKGAPLRVVPSLPVAPEEGTPLHAKEDSNSTRHHLSSLSKQKLINLLLKSMGKEPTAGSGSVEDEHEGEGDSAPAPAPARDDEASRPSDKLRFRAFQATNPKNRGAHSGDASTVADDVEDLAIDDDDYGENTAYHINRGNYDQKTNLDESKEEVRSSWSSSEEALAKCEGLIYNVPLNGETSCTKDITKSDMKRIAMEVTLEVEESGFYYFIFANENEITDNFLSATFDLHKTVFDVSPNVQNCTNATRCELPLSFLSQQNLVVEVGESASEPCDAGAGVVGVSSVEACHHVVVAHSVCQPRKVLYAAFLLLVPVLILLFASI